MAKSKIVDVEGVALSGVTVKRWWQSREVWNGVVNTVVSVVTLLFGIAAIAAPVIIEYVTQLGLSPFRVMLILIAAKVIIEVNQIILKFKTTSIIGSKSDVVVANDATDPTTEVGPH